MATSSVLVGNQIEAITDAIDNAALGDGIVCDLLERGHGAIDENDGLVAESSVDAGGEGVSLVLNVLDVGALAASRVGDLDEDDLAAQRWVVLEQAFHGEELEPDAFEHIHVVDTQQHDLAVIPIDELGNLGFRLR